MTESRGHGPYARSQQVPGGALFTAAADPAQMPAKLGWAGTTWT